MQNIVCRLLLEKKKLRSIIREIEIFDVPRNTGCKVRFLLRGQIDACKAMEFVVVIGGGIDLFPVLRKSATGIRNMRGVVASRDRSLLAGGGVHQPEITFIR